jgi:hypothetical protein
MAMNIRALVLVPSLRRLAPMERRAVEALCGGEAIPRPSDTMLAPVPKVTAQPN